jgi:hypothetical protein
MNSTLRRYGIEPDSKKARIILAWTRKIWQDPAIAAAIPGGAKHIGQILLDPEARDNVLSNGLAHLAPSDRLAYVKLLSRFLDDLVPVNCFGLTDMSAVMNRVSLREMSEPDVDQYFSLLYKVLASDASDAAIPAPTPQQHAAAERQLTLALIAELRGHQEDIERFESYTARPQLATPSDVCWTTRVTLHAIIAMPDPERDIVLLQTVVTHKRQHASSAGRLGTQGTTTPFPASSQPDSVPAP